jgi:hypothetical protein
MISLPTPAKSPPYLIRTTFPSYRQMVITPTPYSISQASLFRNWLIT